MSANQKKNQIIFYWLMVGLIMIIMQVMIGGITRITESGLSITEWQLVKGAMLPTSGKQWQEAFQKYQQTDQYVHLKSHISLSEFKFIYFWEWFHRNWARLIGVVFIIPFIYFLSKKIIRKKESLKYWGLFALGAFQGLMGWLMVKSGLKEGNLFVEHIYLSIHFTLATMTLCYIIYLIYLLKGKTILVEKPFFKWFVILLIISAIQLLYGSFMSGLRAATFAPTWPSINGEIFPKSIWATLGIENIIANPFFIHFVHRNLAYLIFGIIVYGIYHIVKNKIIALYGWSKMIMAIITIQILLGIITVLSSADYTQMRWFAVLHQMTGLIYFVVIVWLRFSLRKI